MELLKYIVGPVITLVVCLIAGYIARARMQAAEQARRDETERSQRDRGSEIRERERELETRGKELELQAKDEAIKLREEVNKETQRGRQEQQKAQRRLEQKEESLDRRIGEMDRRAEKLATRERQVQEAEGEINRLVAEEREELQRIAGLSADEAKQALLKAIEDEIRHEGARLIQEVEAETKREADQRAAKIVGLAIQKCAVDQTTGTTVSVVPLPGDDMKGRIIGREGRNIRAFEQLTGVDLIIDDTPEAVVLSGFDPVRREVARIALSALISDGRIHPGRIEETVQKAQSEVDDRVREAGEQATFETGVSGLHPDLIELLGKLQFRTSFGQNQLRHAIEVSLLAGVMAAELGVKEHIARRAGLLHDIGKAVDYQYEGPHWKLSAEICKSKRESWEICHAVEAHHMEVELETVEACLVQAADAVSASRPGARRETLEAYIKRLEGLETIANQFEGVEKSYAIQAGREIRVVVKPDKIDDLAAHRLAKGMAGQIEHELDYPGQIRVTVIRETRVVEYAK
jgi:ribonuclease Y